MLKFLVVQTNVGPKTLNNNISMPETPMLILYLIAVKVASI